MSGELRDGAPTGSQNSTQEGFFIPSHFNFSIEIGVAPELVDAINGLTEALLGTSEQGVPACSEDGVADEPAGTIVYRPDWIYVEGYRRLRYYEENGKLFLKYSTPGPVETTWSVIDELSSQSGDKYTACRDRLIPEFRFPNQKTCVNQFVKAYREGKVKPSVGPPEKSKSGIPAFEQALKKTPTKNEQNPAESEQKTPETKQISLADHIPVPGYKNLSYQERDSQLTIRYACSAVTTTWEKIEEVSRNGRDAAKPLILAMVGGEKAAKNKMTAVRQFAKAFRDGAVQKPRAPEHGLEENFSRFQTEEDWDPDAAFRPMLTPYYSTRPDGNSGKVEGDVGTGL